MTQRLPSYRKILRWELDNARADITALRAEIAAKDAKIAWWAKVHEEHGGRYWEARYRDEAALVAAKDKEIASLREALRPFAAAAYALEPGDDNGQPFHSSLSVALPEDEHGEQVLVAGFPDKTPLIAFGAGWAKVPASLVCGLTLGDFRQAALATATGAPAPPENAGAAPP